MQRNLLIAVFAAAAAIIGWWQWPGAGSTAAEGNRENAEEITNSGPNGRDSASDGRRDNATRRAKSGERPTLSSRVRLSGESTPGSIPRPRMERRDVGEGKNTAIRRPARELDTADVHRPPAKRLANQAIPDSFAPLVDKAYEAYDARDYLLARRIAEKVLGELPGNVSMKRLVVAASCRLGESDVAKAEATALPPLDAQEVATFCSGVGVTVGD